MKEQVCSLLKRKSVNSIQSLDGPKLLMAYEVRVTVNLFFTNTAQPLVETCFREIRLHSVTVRIASQPLCIIVVRYPKLFL